MEGEGWGCLGFSPALGIPGWTLQWRGEFEPVCIAGVFWGPQNDATFEGEIGFLGWLE